MPPGVSPSSWSLEVARGADLGRRIALATGSATLGNALDGDPGIDLSDLEAASPRKMAAKQAEILIDGDAPSIRDLDSPGGTFVNRRRVLAGTRVPLRDGDLIQLAGVQLRITRSASNPSPREVRPSSANGTADRSPPGVFAFTLKAGGTCRSWDDFLAVSAQKWGDLREELTSGRLSAFLQTIHRADLAPDPARPGSADDRLDLWLSKLPTASPPVPEIDVDPRAITVRGSSGGGTIRRTIRVKNVGYRMLRGTARVAPASANWLRFPDATSEARFALVESTDLAIEVAIPERSAATMSASLTFESDGGTATVPVRVEPSEAREASELAVSPEAATEGLDLNIARTPLISRILIGAIAGATARVILALSPKLTESLTGPGLAGPVVIFGTIGAMGFAGLMVRRRELRDVPPAFASGFLFGAMLAAFLVALSRTIEPSPASWVTALLIWVVLAAILGGASGLILPYRPSNGGEP